MEEKEEGVKRKELVFQFFVRTPSRYVVFPYFLFLGLLLERIAHNAAKSTLHLMEGGGTMCGTLDLQISLIKSDVMKSNHNRLCCAITPILYFP